MSDDQRRRDAEAAAALVRPPTPAQWAELGGTIRPTLPEFLSARITEDTVEATLRQWHEIDCDQMPRFGSDYTYPCDCGVPERMRREAEAKRSIVAAHPHVGGDLDVGCEVCHDYPDEWGYGGGIALDGWCETLRALAAVYAGHPDYDEAWRP